MTDLAFSTDPRPLGKSGILVSPLAWGMWRFAGDDERAARVRVEAALDAGITFLDTADIYGPDNAEAFGAAEALLGRVLADAPELRDRMVLASKGGIRMGVPYDSSDAYLEEAIDRSLVRLGVERLDLWQVHRRDLLARPDAVARAMERMIASGKTRSVGVTNHSAAEVAALRTVLGDALVSVQNEFSPLSAAGLFDGTLDQAMTLGLTVMAWSPLAQGRLGDAVGDERAHAVRSLLDTKAFESGVDRASAAYAWIGCHPAGIIPIVGTQNAGRIARAADAHRVGFTRAEWYAVLQAGMGARLP